MHCTFHPAWFSECLPDKMFVTCEACSDRVPFEKSVELRRHKDDAYFMRTCKECYKVHESVFLERLCNITSFEFKLQILQTIIETNNNK